MNRVTLAMLVTCLAATARAQTMSFSPEYPRPGDSVTVTTAFIADAWGTSSPVVKFDGSNIILETTSGGACIPEPAFYTRTATFVAPSTGLYEVRFVRLIGAGWQVVATRQLQVAPSCDFTHSLSVDAAFIDARSPATLSWCDPASDSFQVYVGTTLEGPFTRLAELDGSTSRLAVQVPVPRTFYYYVQSRARSGAVAVSNVVAVTGISGASCQPSPTTLCVVGRRFGATARFRVGSSPVLTYGRAVSVTDPSGYFWFFGPDNVEVTLKMIDACPASYWLFASGMTNVGVTINVTDFKTGRTASYSNPVGTPFAAILDTNAFPCP